MFVPVVVAHKQRGGRPGVKLGNQERWRGEWYFSRSRCHWTPLFYRNQIRTISTTTPRAAKGRRKMHAYGF